MKKILVTVKNRANRILSKTVKGYSAYEKNDDSQLIISFLLKPDEYIIGLYLNEPYDTETGILISSQGLYTQNEFISYSEIQDISYESIEPKHKTDTLTITAKDCIYNLLLAADHGRFSDVFEFSRFLNRVVEDNKLNE